MCKECKQSKPTYEDGTPVPPFVEAFEDALYHLALLATGGIAGAIIMAQYLATTKGCGL